MKVSSPVSTRRSRLWSRRPAPRRGSGISRATVPCDVAGRIPRQDAANMDTHAILRTCLDSPGGLRELLTV
ncbi:effector-associated domain 2-containing protein [Actinomadura alba]|uniref:effector-associated domain 2-containing protein n=1 Tax=Actinomadura alba TaxID=406431 RepID=UPI0035E41790